MVVGMPPVSGAATVLSCYAIGAMVQTRTATCGRVVAIRQRGSTISGPGAVVSSQMRAWAARGGSIRLDLTVSDRSIENHARCAHHYIAIRQILPWGEDYCS